MTRVGQKRESPQLFEASRHTFCTHQEVDVFYHVDKSLILAVPDIRSPPRGSAGGLDRNFGRVLALSPSYICKKKLAPPQHRARKTLLRRTTACSLLTLSVVI
jgi:hypothetical protein